MDWDRSRRFDDHRGGESYRPTGSRGYSRPISPRNRSPRLVADTWVPSASRTYGRPRSRSPPAFRRRSRSPSFYNRDAGLGSYTKTSSPPRRLSPRRDRRPRSPQTSWRSRSPYNDSRSRDISRGRTTPKWREPSPSSQEFRFPRKERYPLPAADQYIRSTSPSRRAPPRENDPRAPIVHRPRSPFHGRRDRPSENISVQRRRSPSLKGASSVHNSAAGSVSNSRRSSPLPLPDKFSTSYDSRGRSPATQALPHRHLSRNSDLSPSRQARTPSAKYRISEDETRTRSPVVEQATLISSRGVDPENPVLSRLAESQDKDHTHLNTAGSIPNQPKAYGVFQGQSPPSGPSAGPKSFPSQNRGPNISLLSAPTRPRGTPNFKENVWASTPARRGPVAVSHVPPTGPRSNHIPTGPGSEPHRQNIYRQNSFTGNSYPRTPRYTNHLSGLCSIIPGGRPLSSNLDMGTEKRLSQLDTDKERLFEQIADSQRLKRLGIRDWERLDRESSICALKSELAEGHLQRITDGESVHVGTTF